MRVTAAFAAQEAVSQEPASAIGAIISQLESPSFKKRQQATRLLLKMGDRAIEPLLKRVQTGRLELAVRAVSIFESAYIGKDPAAIAAADKALEGLVFSQRQELAEQAQGVLSRNVETRVRIALASLEQLGARVYNFDRPPDGWAEPPALRQGLVDREPPSVVLNERWKGGADGLKYVRRLRGTGVLIYLIDGVKIPEKRIVELESVFDTTTIARRGSGMLGIKGSSNPGGCFVSDVVEGLAGAQAGLKAGDTILELDGRIVRDFPDLVDQLRSRKAGQSIKLKVERDLSGKVENLEATLGEWHPPTNKPRRVPPGLKPAKKPEQKP
jgi:hypothetical protein